MKSGIEMVQDIFTLINVNAVQSLITGVIILFERPQNSEKQDVVVGTLALTAEQFQNGVTNVNVHCPNLSVVTDGETDNTQPDVTSLKAIGNSIIGICKDYNGFDFKIDVQSPGMVIRDEKDGSYYLNIRVNYRAFQQNFTNI